MRKITNKMFAFATALSVIFSYTTTVFAITNLTQNPVVVAYKGPYNGKAHGLEFSNIPDDSKIQYKNSRGVWTNYKITRTKVGTTTVEYKITSKTFRTYYGKAQIKINNIEDNSKYVYPEADEFNNLKNDEEKINATIQKAINENKTVVLQEKYIVNNPIIISQPVSIVGGGTIETPSNKVNYGTYNEYGEYGNFKPIFAIKSNDVSISNLYLKSTNDQNPAIDVALQKTDSLNTAKASNVTAIYGNGISNLTLEEIKTENMSFLTGGRFTDFNINNCRSDGYDFFVRFSNSKNIYIKNCILNGNDTGLGYYYHTFYLNGGNENIRVNNIEIYQSSTTSINDVFHVYTSNNINPNINIYFDNIKIKGYFKTLAMINNTKSIKFSNINYELNKDADKETRWALINVAKYKYLTSGNMYFENCTFDLRNENKLKYKIFLYDNQKTTTNDKEYYLQKLSLINCKFLNNLNGFNYKTYVQNNKPAKYIIQK